MHRLFDHQLVIELAINAACELGRGTTASVHLSQDLRLAFEAVAAILLDLGRGLGHRVPVAGEKNPRLQRRQAVERPEVCGDVAFRIGDHRAALAEDQVPGEDRAVLGDQKAKVVGAVAGRVERGDVERAGTDDIAIRQLRVSLHRGLEPARKPLRERKVIWMPVRDEHHPDRLARQPLVQRREMFILVGTRVDDHDHRARPHDPRVGARPGVWTGVGRNDPGDLRQRGW